MTTGPIQPPRPAPRARARLALACTLLAAAAPLHAGQALRICSDDRAHPPYFYLDREGSVQTLVRMAAAQVGMKVEIAPMPVRRCRAEAQRGGVDAVLMTAFVDANARDLVYPMREGRADADKSVAQTRAMVFRRKGSKASWDGKRFSLLTGPILVPTSYAFISHHLKQLNVPFDDGARDAEQNFMKLLGSRADLVILPENDGLELLRNPKWGDRIEVLPAPFTSQEFYLAFSSAFFQEHPAVAAAFWRAIADIRNSREFRQAVGQVQEAPARN